MCGAVSWVASRPTDSHHTEQVQRFSHTSLEDKHRNLRERCGVTVCFLYYHQHFSAAHLLLLVSTDQESSQVLRPSHEKSIFTNCKGRRN
ncbi:hypothetical protein SRHO_G00333740 [Serrasalmus rhombeus]